MSGKVTRRAEDRFWEKVAKSSDPSGCWIWTAARNEFGYGCFWWDGRLGKAHRFSYERQHGVIAAGLVIDHLCFVPACVNPAHLRAITVKQNEEHRQRANHDSATGIRGVSWNKHRNKWEVRATHHGRKLFGGYFNNLTDADDRATAMRAAIYSHDDGIYLSRASLDDELDGKAIARAAEWDDLTDTCD